MKNVHLLFLLCAVAQLASSFPLEGLNHLGVGFDVIQGRPKIPIVQYTFDSKSSWYNPFTHQRTETPDEVSVSVSASFRKQVVAFSGVTAYTQALANASAVESYYTDVAFSSSGQAVQFQQLFFAEEVVLIQVTSQYVLYTIQLFPAEVVQTNALMQAAEDNLPEKYDENSYFQMLETYGTHVVVEVALGGQAVLQTFANSTALGVKGALAAQQVAYAATVNVSQAAAGQIQSLAEGLQQGSVLFEQFAVDGGLAETVNQNQTEWLHSVKQVPTVVSYRLKPISDFLKNTEKKANMQKAHVLYAEKLKNKDKK
mmetsp:Transcript_9276/g.12773  ORF Transcript_9276/g.12773 Transcript_9276/m.12773 type:complete len:313 (+) Transcript_9276:371-1309(+)